MAKAQEAWRQEIEALRAEIEEIKARKPEAAEAVAGMAKEAQAKAGSVHKSVSDMIDQTAEVIGDLQRRFSEGTQTAEDTVTEHPIATLASAFLLGLLIGRISR